VARCFGQKKCYERAGNGFLYPNRVSTLETGWRTSACIGFNLQIIVNARVGSNRKVGAFDAS